MTIFEFVIIYDALWVSVRALARESVLFREARYGQFIRELLL